MRIMMQHKTQPHTPLMITNVFSAEGRIYAHANIYGTNFDRKEARENFERIKNEKHYSDYYVTLEG